MLRDAVVPMPAPDLSHPDLDASDVSRESTEVVAVEETTPPPAANVNYDIDELLLCWADCCTIYACYTDFPNCIGCSSASTCCCCNTETMEAGCVI